MRKFYAALLAAVLPLSCKASLPIVQFRHEVCASYVEDACLNLVVSAQVITRLPEADPQLFAMVTLQTLRPLRIGRRSNEWTAPSLIHLQRAGVWVDKMFFDDHADLSGTPANASPLLRLHVRPLTLPSPELRVCPQEVSAEPARPCR